MLKRLIRSSILALAVLMTAATAHAAPYLYGDFIGMNPGEVDFLQVKENSVTDPGLIPLFDGNGAPIRIGNTLKFTPTTFVSYAHGGSADTTSGTLTMRIRADVGQFLGEIRIREIGDASLLGSGNAATAATINGLLVISDIDPGLISTQTSILTVNPAAPFTLPGTEFVQFVAETVIDLTGLGVRQVAFNFNNTLQTTSQNGTTSFIQKKEIEIIVPEPGTMSLLIVGAALVLRRGRRRSV